MRFRYVEGGVGLKAGLISSGVPYNIVGNIISEDEWREIKEGCE